MRSSSFSPVETPSGKYQPRIRGLNVQTVPTRTLANGIVKKSQRKPQQCGCFSELSCGSEDYHLYDDALKSYVEAYRISHTYIESGAMTVEHDYTLSVAETEEHGVLGLLGDDIEQSMRSHVQFSDEEIEQYGYLGWIQH